METAPAAASTAVDKDAPVVPVSVGPAVDTASAEAHAADPGHVDEDVELGTEAQDGAAGPPRPPDELDEIIDPDSHPDGHVDGVVPKPLAERRRRCVRCASLRVAACLVVGVAAFMGVAKHAAFRAAFSLVFTEVREQQAHMHAGTDEQDTRSEAGFVLGRPDRTSTVTSTAPSSPASSAGARWACTSGLCWAPGSDVSWRCEPRVLLGFVSNRKTGTTSTAELMRECCESPRAPISMLRGPGRSGLDVLHHDHPSSAIWISAVGRAAWDAALTFTVVRDPWQRSVSNFEQWVVIQGKRVHGPYHGVNWHCEPAWRDFRRRRAAFHAYLEVKMEGEMQGDETMLADEQVQESRTESRGEMDAGGGDEPMPAHEEQQHEMSLEALLMALPASVGDSGLKHASDARGVLQGWATHGALPHRAPRAIGFLGTL